MPAYLDGWLAIKDTEKVPEVEAFMNFLLEPKNYAEFINTIGSAYVMPAAEEFINQEILDNPSLKFDAAAVKSVEFETFLGEEATKIRTRAWQEVKNA
jgi:putative spermidine/putrescine transport system substrate-binding protein/putrescine transport system substrate-binding protein